MKLIVFLHQIIFL